MERPEPTRDRATEANASALSQKDLLTGNDTNSRVNQMRNSTNTSLNGLPEVTITGTLIAQAAPTDIIVPTITKFADGAKNNIVNFVRPALPVVNGGKQFIFSAGSVAGGVFTAVIGDMVFPQSVADGMVRNQKVQRPQSETSKPNPHPTEQKPKPETSKPKPNPAEQKPKPETSKPTPHPTEQKPKPETNKPKPHPTDNDSKTGAKKSTSNPLSAFTDDSPTPKAGRKANKGIYTDPLAPFTTEKPGPLSNPKRKQTVPDAPNVVVPPPFSIPGDKPVKNSPSPIRFDPMKTESVPKPGSINPDIKKNPEKLVPTGNPERVTPLRAVEANSQEPEPAPQNSSNFKNGDRVKVNQETETREVVGRTPDGKVIVEKAVAGSPAQLAQTVTKDVLQRDYQKFYIRDKGHYIDRTGTIYDEIFKAPDQSVLTESRQLKAVAADQLSRVNDRPAAPSQPEKIVNIDPESAKQLKPGRYVSAKSDGELWEIKGFTNDTGAVITTRVKPDSAVNATAGVKVSPEELRLYPKVKVGDKTSYRDAAGNVYENKGSESEPRLVQDKNQHVFQRDQVSLTKPEFSLSTDQLGRPVITYAVDGKEVKLTKQKGQDWVYGYGAATGAGSSTGWTKVHVDVANTRDLADVQRTILSELGNSKSALSQLVGEYKTFDPRLVDGDPKAFGDAPTGEGQGAKGFTLYTRTPEQAYKIQKEIDSLLEKAGLALGKPVDDSNAAMFSGKTNRVSVTRDTYQASDYRFDGNLFNEQGDIPSVKVDPEIVSNLRTSENGVAGQKFSEEELSQIEIKANLKPKSLAYDQAGDLVLADFYESYRYKKGGVYHGGRYLTEDDRRGMYELAKIAKQDPAKLALAKNLGMYNPNAMEIRPKSGSENKEITELPLRASFGGESLSPKVGEIKSLGRDYQHRETDGLVSRHHADLSRDARGNLVITDKNSTNGTWVKRSDENNYTRIKAGQGYVIRKGDEIRLGRPTGPKLNIGN